jgi:hypothetical protein
LVDEAAQPALPVIAREASSYEVRLEFGSGELIHIR